MKTWQLGISAFSWLSDENVLRREAETALSMGYRFAYGSMAVWEDDRLETAHRVFRQCGLPFYSVHGITGVDSWEFDVHNVASGMIALLERIDRLDIRNITFHTLVPGDEREDPTEVAAKRPGLTDRFCRLFELLMPVAEQFGISVNVENVEDWFDSAYVTAEEVLEIVERVDHPHIGACLDSGHAHMSGIAPSDMVRGLAPYLREVHFHDNFGEYDKHLPVGAGTINWLDVMYALHETAYDRPVTFEMVSANNEGERFADKARLSYDNWRRIERIAALGEK